MSHTYDVAKQTTVPPHVVGRETLPEPDLWFTFSGFGLEIMFVSARESWMELRKAVRGARHADRLFLQSLRDFAALGPEVEEISQDAIQRQQGILAPLGELESLADEYLVTIAAVEQPVR